MVLLHSKTIKLGMLAPDFKLGGVDGNFYTLDDFRTQKMLLIMFLCNHCPYVQALEDRILQLHRTFELQGVQFVGICSNDPTDYPDDLPENLKARWLSKNYRFPYLIDETQKIAKAYGAVCTPEFYLFNEKRILSYHGRLDNDWQDATRVTHQDLREAIEALLTERELSENQSPSMGCSIKWRKT